MADEIIRLDYSAEDIGDNIDEVRTARGTYESLDARLDNIEGGGPSPSNPIASNCVSPMTGYSKSSSSTPGNISTDDTLNAAIGKLEKRTELNENNISYIISNSYKNKLHYKSGYVAGFTQTIGEVTFTINDDLSITANSNGNAVTANRTFSIYNGLPFHVAGDIISGGVSSQCSVECELAANPYTNYGYSTGSARTMTAATGTVEVFCRVKAGAAVNVTFYPMICDAGFFAVANTYVPFRVPNLRLVRDKKIMLKDSDITWKQSSAGLYYTDPIAISGINYVVSAIITTFAYLSDSNIIQVIGSDTVPNSIRFMANSDNIASNAYVRVTVLGF